MDETASDAGDKEVVIDHELDGVLKSLATGVKHLIEALGLGDGARETVQDEAAN